MPPQFISYRPVNSCEYYYYYALFYISFYNDVQFVKHHWGSSNSKNTPFFLSWIILFSLQILIVGIYNEIHGIRHHYFFADVNLERHLFAKKQILISKERAEINQSIPFMQRYSRHREKRLAGSKSNQSQFYYRIKKNNLIHCEHVNTKPVISHQVDENLVICTVNEHVENAIV